MDGARDPNIVPTLKKVWTGVQAGGRMAGRAVVGAAGGASRRRLKSTPITRDQVAKQGAIAAGVGLSLAAFVIMMKASEAKKRKRKPSIPLPQDPKGRPLCPTDVPGHAPPDLTGVKKGDFVIVTLSNEPGTLRESTWAEVLGVGGNKIAVQLVAAQRQKFGGPVSEVVPESLKSEWHGFHTGQKMFLSPTCIWDVLHTHVQPGTLVCGRKGEAVSGKPPIGDRFLAENFRVTLILGSPGGSAVETVWAAVRRISPTGSVITAQLDEIPKHTNIHGFGEGDTIEFARDCIFGIQPV